MSNSRTTSENAAADLARLQQELLRTRIDRARRMTEEQRLAEAFALTDSALVLMHEGVMAEMAAPDPALGWQEVRRRLERLRRDARTHSRGGRRRRVGRRGAARRGEAEAAGRAGDEGLQVGR